MKINFIIPFKRISGGIRVVYIYANYLVQQGHDVCCYLPAVSYKGLNQGVFFRIKASLSNLLKKENWFKTNFPVKVVPWISNTFVRDADVVVATSWQTSYDVKKLCEGKGRKFYFIQDYEVFNGSVAQVEESYALGLNMLTISKELQLRLNQFSTNVPVIHNGLFGEEYISGEKRKNRPFTVMFMYHEAPHKGTNVAIQTVKILKKKYPEIRVVVFGRRIDAHFPSDYIVKENPSREDLLELYRESDVYLFTSTIEAWGLPVVEAMANKCAVIGRKIGALNELYDGANAVIVESDSQFVDCVTALYCDIVSLRKIQENSYLSAKCLNWNIAGMSFERLIMK